MFHPGVGQGIEIMKERPRQGVVKTTNIIILAMQQGSAYGDCKEI